MFARLQLASQGVLLRVGKQLAITISKLPSPSMLESPTHFSILEASFSFPFSFNMLVLSPPLKKLSMYLLVLEIEIEYNHEEVTEAISRFDFNV